MSISANPIPKPQQAPIPFFRMFHNFVKGWSQVKMGEGFAEPDSIALTPSVAVPVGYQWEVTSIAIPFDVWMNIIGTAGHRLTESTFAQVITMLRMNSELVWLTSDEIPLMPSSASELEGAPQVWRGRAVIAEDFVNPIIVDQGNHLMLEAECQFASHNGEGGMDETKLYAWSGELRNPEVSTTTGIPPQGALHYALVGV